VAVALLGLHAAIAWLARRPGILTTQDDAIYLLLGRALQALNYREVYRVDGPVHMMYPPGYPALLALWSAVGGEGFNWLVLVGIASSVGALALIFSALRTLSGPRLAIACLAALAFNPALVDSAGAVAAEAPFIFFEFLALWTFTREPDRRYTALAIVASIAAALTRSIGVTLIAAIGLFWLWRRRFQTLALYAVAAALTVGLWLGWTVIAPEQVPGRSYIADASAGGGEHHASRSSVLVQRLTNKAPYVLTTYKLLPGAYLSDRAKDNVIGMSIMLIALLPGLPALWTTWPAAFLYLASYLGLLLLWPWPVPRFMVPVMPLMVVTTILGAGWLVRRFRPRWEETAVLVVAGVLALDGLAIAYDVIHRQRSCVPGAPLPTRACLDENQASFISTVEFIRDHVPPDAIFLSGKAATLYFYTGHRVVSMPQALNRMASEFLPYLRQHGVTRVLLLRVMPFSDGMSPSVRLALGPMLRANCEHLQLEASFPPGSALFRLPATDENPDPAAACRAVDDYLNAVKLDGEARQ
jgi:4-amino-4-deoxy-L-arabinose transferase-like glycosyltransferase